MEHGLKDNMATITLRGSAGVLIVYSAILLSSGIALFLPAFLGFDYKSLGLNQDLFHIGQYLFVVAFAVFITSVGLIIWKHNWPPPQPSSVHRSESAIRIYSLIAIGLGMLTIIADFLYLLFSLIVSGLARLDYSSPVALLPGISFFLATVILPAAHVIAVFLVLRQLWLRLAPR